MDDLGKDSVFNNGDRVAQPYVEILAEARQAATAARHAAENEMDNERVPNLRTARI